MRFIAMAVAPVLGILIFLTGVGFGISYVGLPYPDAPPHLQAQYESNMGIAEVIVLAGGLIFAIGILLIPVITLVTRKKTRHH